MPSPSVSLTRLLKRCRKCSSVNRLQKSSRSQCLDIAGAFNVTPSHQIGSAESKSKPRSITIEGGKFDAYVLVRRWISSGGKKGNTIGYKHFLPTPAFYDYGILWMACQHLKVQQLSDQVVARIEDIAATQVDTFDIEQIFSSPDSLHKFNGWPGRALDVHCGMIDSSSTIATR